MNRRNFIRGLLVSGAAFTVLPGAGRLWRAQRASVRQLTERDLNEFLEALFDFNRNPGRVVRLADRLGGHVTIQPTKGHP